MGDVKVIVLAGHPNARKAYAFGHTDGTDDMGNAL